MVELLEKLQWQAVLLHQVQPEVLERQYHNRGQKAVGKKVGFQQTPTLLCGQHQLHRQ
jgi:hypothetical protein